jgi:cytoskeletal protein RodZ
LFEHWATLKNLVVAERDDLILPRARVAASHERWRAENRDGDFLLPPGKQLSEAEQLLAEYGEELTPELKAYVAASMAQAHAQQKRRQRLLVGALLVFAMLAVAASAAAIFGFWQKSNADKQAKLATSAEKQAKEGKAEAERQAALAKKEAVLARAAEDKAKEAASQANVSLARNSIGAGDDAQALAYLANALRLNLRNYEAGALTAALLTQTNWPVAMTNPMKHDDEVRSAEFSPDGQRVVTASADKTAQVWDAATGKPIGEPMKHDNWVYYAEFSPDRQRVVTASADKTARVWDVPTLTVKDSVEEVPLFADLAEATCGLALQSSGPTVVSGLAPDKAKATRELRRKFTEQSRALTPLQRLMKWSVADPRTRTISPFSDITVPEWVNNRIQEGTLDDLRTAMQMDPANARLVAHFGMALANLAVAEKTDPDDARRARAEADYQTHRALKLAPENDEVKRLRAEVLEMLN